MTMPQPAQASQRFVEQTTSYHLDAAGSDPELKKILPLMFSSLAVETESEELGENTEIFAKLYVDNSEGKVKKSISTQKMSPIAADQLTGVSSRFTRFHPGIDYRAKVGTPIHAILPGTVNEVSFERGGYGRYVILVHHVDGKTIFSLYAHLRKTHVSAGDAVDVGDVIGEVGMTGRTTGPHLHFELHDSSRAMDPLRFLSGNNLAMVTK